MAVPQSASTHGPGKRQEPSRSPYHALPRTFFARNHYANATAPNSHARPRRRPRRRGCRWLGPRGPAFARRASGLHDRCGQFFTCRRKRLDQRHHQSAAHHRRPSLVGCACTYRTADRRRNDSHECRHRTLHTQSGRPHRPTATHTRHAECTRTPTRSQSSIRSRHAESGLYAAPSRRIPDRSRSRWSLDDDHCAQRPG